MARQTGVGGDTIHGIISDRARNAPDRAAILGLAAKPLTFGGLDQLISRTLERLNTLGIGRKETVAIVLPNGPLMATAFLSISSAATCAPLNPGYTAAEFEFYLNDLRPRALIVQAALPSPARDVARARGIPLLELQPAEDQPAGVFTLQGGDNGIPASAGPTRTGDVALLLHTSGTTSRPKIVPLTHKNLCASARSIVRSLQLGEADRCLNIMPLFHIHGLVAALLASLMAGASVACTQGFLAPEFFEWLETFEPTWYTAVPSMHQAILARADSNRGILEGSRLRLIRSCSSPLAPKVMHDLEAAFHVPVIEAYGMTEASHQMASNPLPPGIRKPGSVGLPAGPEIAIMGPGDKRLRPAGETGEIVIRGGGVTRGYANNPEANQAAFTDGWFRTGDQGYLDSEGYLFITGRLKEIINRGGEKISPREIDEVFLAHPAVAQAVTFALPDDRLGETVAVAIVLRDPKASPEELRKYASQRLALFKVPENIILLQEIPKGPTGKIQRIGMAARLGLAGVEPAAAEARPFVAPRTDLEKDIAAIWQEVLRRDRIGVNDRFRSSGGDSMLATVIHLRIEDRFKIRLPLADLYAAATIAEQAALVESVMARAAAGKREE